VILKLEVPFLNAAIRGGSVDSWHKREGDQISYGEAVCDLVVDEKLALRKSNQANRLVRAARNRRASNERYEWRKGRILLRYRLTSSESSRTTLRTILAGKGERVLVGDVLAVVTTEVTEPDPGSAGPWETVPSARLVSNLLEWEDA
jgi:hypothetical protein